MAEKKFKLSTKDACHLIWDKILCEDSDNFTPDFNKTVLEILKEIREVA